MPPQCRWSRTPPSGHHPTQGWRRPTATFHCFQQQPCSCGAHRLQGGSRAAPEGATQCPQPCLVVGDPAHNRGVETRWSLKSFSTQAILWFYDFLGSCSWCKPPGIWAFLQGVWGAGVCLILSHHSLLHAHLEQVNILSDIEHLSISSTTLL